MPMASIFNKKNYSCESPVGILQQFQVTPPSISEEVLDFDEPFTKRFISIGRSPMGWIHSYPYSQSFSYRISFHHIPILLIFLHLPFFL